MTAGIERITNFEESPSVRGVFHRPAKPNGNGLVLTHGAGGNCEAPLLVALAESFAESGLAVLRCDLPFRQQRPSGPPRGNGAEDREGLRRVVRLLRKSVSGRMFLGGQSYGGRQASMLAAEEAKSVDGLLLLSYPLHPPGKPDVLRTAHLPRINVPTLFASGTKDPFGSPAEIQSALRLIPARTSLLLIDGAGHDLGFGRRANKKMQDVPQRIVRAFSNLQA